MGVRDGTLSGGLPFLAVGAGPPVVVFPGLGAEHANPTGMERRFQLRQWTPLAAHHPDRGVVTVRLQGATRLDGIADFWRWTSAPTCCPRSHSVRSHRTGVYSRDPCAPTDC
jgi:hypothetical protein